MRLVRILLIFSLVTPVLSGVSQECAGFHTQTCPIPDFSYYYDQQSASFNLKVGDTAELQIVVFEKTDYYLSVCAHRRVNNVQIKVLEDSSDRTLLYDNIAEGFVDSVKFTNNSTRKIILEVMLPEQGNNRANDGKERCVGVLIAKRIKVDEF